MSKYEVMGVIHIPKLSITDHRISLNREKLDGIFFADHANKHRKLVSERSAFRVVETDLEGRAVGEFLAVVERVDRYYIYADGTVDLTFGYRRSDEMDRTTHRIGAIVADAIVDADFCAIKLAGARSDAEEWVLDHPTIIAGDTSYRSEVVNTVVQRLVDGGKDEYVASIAIYAANDPVSESAMGAFTDRAIQLLVPPENTSIMGVKRR